MIKSCKVKETAHVNCVYRPRISAESSTFTTIVFEASSRDFRTGLSWELHYIDDIVLIADSLEKAQVTGGYGA